jgi:hypothetical protein
MKIYHHALAACGLCAALTSASATDAEIYDVHVESLAIVAAPFGGHVAGNMEIKVVGGFVLPPGLNCTDNVYVTTPRSADPQRKLFKQLLEGMTAYKGYFGRLRISDQLGGFPGRCGIVAAELFSAIY